MTSSLPTSTSERWKAFFSTYTTYIHITIILLLGVACYHNSLSVPLQFDDDPTVRIINNLDSDLFSIQGFIRKARWFADITFALNRTLHGERLLGYHLINLAIHLSTAGAIYLLVQRAIAALMQTFRIPREDQSVPFLQGFTPLATAALFVCHPVQTQAVTYIAQRYTSLATLLYVASLLSYLLARLAGGNESPPRQRWLWGCAAFVLALLAMKSKEIAFTLPLMVLALEAILFKGQLLKSRSLIALGAGLLLVIPLQLLYTHGTGGAENLIHSMQMATAETQNISRSDYLLTQFRVVATYLRLLILPINQNLDYDYPVYHSLLNPYVVSGLLLHLSLLGAALALYVRSHARLSSARPATGISMRMAALGILWFYLALSVESSLIPIRDVIFEHRLYLPSVGFFMAVAAGLAGLAAGRQRYRSACWIGTILLCSVFLAATIARNRVWSDEMLLWQDTVEKSPNKARARYAVGWLYFKKIMPEKALPHLVRALEIDPAKQKHWNTLNFTVAIMDRYAGRCSAGQEYELVDPGHRTKWMANSYNSLGLAYEHLGNLFLARENYQKATVADPDLDLAWYNLALAAAKYNDPRAVSTALKSLKALNPQLEQSAVKTLRELPNSVQLVPQ